MILSFTTLETYCLIRRGRRMYRVLANPFPFVYRVVEYKPWRF